jgi:shikimate kinase|tara:strand:+ start:302 stop:832 length:531 start_codon:yes stop_codon:yes gene_type:complete
MIVVLLGYMGSGKSTVGSLLASKLELEFQDLDNYIENQYNCSVANIYKSKGEIYFRKIEAVAVKELCSKSSDLVLALGGGTPCYSDTMTYLLKQNKVVTVMLKTSILNLTQRLMDEKSGRPLISNLRNDEIPGFIAKHLFERSAFYNKAEISVLTDMLTKHEVVERVISRLPHNNF